MVSRASTQATIVGDVRSPMTIEVGPKGQRVLDMIAKAGGIVHPGYETYITVQRGNRKATVYFDTILGNPRENIYIHPDDTVYAYGDRIASLPWAPSGCPESSTLMRPR